MVSQALDKFTSPIAERMGLGAEGAAYLSQAIMSNILAGAVELPIDIFTTSLFERVIRLIAGVGAMSVGLLPVGVEPRDKATLFSAGVQMMRRAIQDSIDPEELELMKGNLYALKNGVSYGSIDSILRSIIKLPTRTPDFGAQLHQLVGAFGRQRVQTTSQRPTTAPPPVEQTAQLETDPFAIARQPSGSVREQTYPIF
jgi:hypothetical protein